MSRPDAADGPASSMIERLYVVFDKNTGRIVHRQSRYDVEAGTHVEIPAEEVLALAREAAGLDPGGGDKAGADLAVLELADVAEGATVQMRVNVPNKDLVRRPTLVVTPERRELEGDGSDTITVRITAADAQGRPVKDFGGPVRVTTTRGKLSARGGRLDLKDGAGEIRLTSVNETVGRVRIAARCAGGICVGGEAEVEFV